MATKVRENAQTSSPKVSKLQLSHNWLTLYHWIYIGVVATPTDRVLPATQRAESDGAEDVEAEPEEPVKIMEMQSTFDEFVVWGHEALPAADDTFVKGVEEWLQFADAVCFSPPILVYLGYLFFPWFFPDCLLDAYSPSISDEWKGVCCCLRKACWVRMELMEAFCGF